MKEKPDFMTSMTRTGRIDRIIGSLVREAVESHDERTPAWIPEALKSAYVYVAQHAADS